eukprot:scaffold47_cov258-Pinguiococcus_pyrenoidosus.AAC.102
MKPSNHIDLDSRGNRSYRYRLDVFDSLKEIEDRPSSWNGVDSLLLLESTGEKPGRISCESDQLVPSVEMKSIWQCLVPLAASV